MELKEAIIKRRSIREFDNREISKEDVEQIVLSATLAPSACNNQSWKFIVINDAKIKERIVEEGGASFIKNAPLGIVVAYDNRTDNLEYGDYIQSAAGAIQNMLLTATSLGIGSCWVCHLPTKATMRKILEIPNCFDPIAYIVLGYSTFESKVRLKKYSSNDIISWNIFNFGVNKQSSVSLFFKRIARSFYFCLPASFKKYLKPFAEKFVKKFD